jgi:hypothetical protein
MEMAINNLKKKKKETKPQYKTEIIRSYELRKTTNTKQYFYSRFTGHKNNLTERKTQYNFAK